MTHPYCRVCRFGSLCCLCWTTVERHLLPLKDEWSIVLVNCVSWTGYTKCGCSYLLIITDVQALFLAKEGGATGFYISKFIMKKRKTNIPFVKVPSWCFNQCFEKKKKNSLGDVHCVTSKLSVLLEKHFIHLGIPESADSFWRHLSAAHWLIFGCTNFDKFCWTHPLNVDVRGLSCGFFLVFADFFCISHGAQSLQQGLTAPNFLNVF